MRSTPFRISTFLRMKPTGTVLRNPRTASAGLSSVASMTVIISVLSAPARHHPSGAFVPGRRGGAAPFGTEPGAAERPAETKPGRLLAEPPPAKRTYGSADSEGDGGGAHRDDAFAGRDVPASCGRLAGASHGERRITGTDSVVEVAGTIGVSHVRGPIGVLRPVVKVLRLARIHEKCGRNYVCSRVDVEAVHGVALDPDVDAVDAFLDGGDFGLVPLVEEHGDRDRGEDADDDDHDQELDEGEAPLL